MFEKDAEEIANKRCHEIMCWGHCNFSSPKHHRCGEWHREYNCAKEGIEYGYNKANEWQFVSEKGLPKENGRYLVYVGGGEKGVYPLDFDTEANDFGYWCLQVGESLGVSDTVFETVTERKEDKVIAWKELVPPSESMRSFDKNEQKKYTEAINKVYKPTGVKLFDKESE